MLAKQSDLIPNFCVQSVHKHLKESQGAVNFLVFSLWPGATSVQKAPPLHVLGFETHSRHIIQMLAKPSCPTLDFAAPSRPTGSKDLRDAGKVPLTLAFLTI
jgi:hypothetical protein